MSVQLALHHRSLSFHSRLVDGPIHVISKPTACLYILLSLDVMIATVIIDALSISSHSFTHLASIITVRHTRFASNLRCAFTWIPLASPHHQLMRPLCTV